MNIATTTMCIGYHAACFFVVCTRHPVNGFSGVGRRSRSTLGLCSLRENADVATATSSDQNDGRVVLRRVSDDDIDDVELARLSGCTSGATARRILRRALSGDDALFRSLTIPPLASAKYLSDAELAIQTNVRNQRKKVTELVETNGDADADRASLFVLGLFVASMSSAVAASESLPGPEIVRFVVVWLLSFAPLLFVGVGLAVPQELQVALIQLQAAVLPSYKQRMIQHEAGHFLMGHLLGLPVKEYRADSAIKSAVEFYPLKDKGLGQEKARSMGFVNNNNKDDDDTDDDYNYNDNNGYDRPFFSEGGRGDVLLQNSVLADPKENDLWAKQVPNKDKARDAWPFRRLDDDTLDVFSVVSLAGVTAEILAFGDGQGGFADLAQLSIILKDNVEDDNNGDFDKTFQTKVRFALGYNFSQMRRHLGALDALAAVMERGGSVEECVRAIETCEDASGLSNVFPGPRRLQRYESLRKERLQQDYTVLEKLVLKKYADKNGTDKGATEGRGGGDREDDGKFAVTGDDPLYLAGAAAVSFFVWASSGGLSLH